MINLYLLAPPTLDGNIIMAIAFVTVVSGLVGLFSKYKVFLILANAGYGALMVEFQDYEFILIGLVAVIIFNFYKAFIGD